MKGLRWLNSRRKINGQKLLTEEEVRAGIDQAYRHGHPSWNHVLAHGPCTRKD